MTVPAKGSLHVVPRLVGIAGDNVLQSRRRRGRWEGTHHGAHLDITTDACFPASPWTVNTHTFLLHWHVHSPSYHHTHPHTITLSLLCHSHITCLGQSITLHSFTPFNLTHVLCTISHILTTSHPPHTLLTLTLVLLL